MSEFRSSSSSSVPPRGPSFGSEPTVDRHGTPKSSKKPRDPTPFSGVTSITSGSRSTIVKAPGEEKVEPPKRERNNLPATLQRSPSRKAKVLDWFRRSSTPSSRPPGDHPHPLRVTSGLDTHHGLSSPRDSLRQHFPPGGGLTRSEKPVTLILILSSPTSAMGTDIETCSPITKPWIPVGTPRQDPRDRSRYREVVQALYL
jgi:hypothetical protein